MHACAFEWADAKAEWKAIDVGDVVPNAASCERVLELGDARGQVVVVGQLQGHAARGDCLVLLTPVGSGLDDGGRGRAVVNADGPEVNIVAAVVVDDGTASSTDGSRKAQDACGGRSSRAHF